MGNHMLLLMLAEGVVIDFVDLKDCVACVCVCVCQPPAKWSDCTSEVLQIAAKLHSWLEDKEQRVVAGSPVL